MSAIKDLLPDFPSGPLDRYRKQASFDWRSMALIIDNEERLKFKVQGNIYVITFSFQKNYVVF